MFSFFSYGFVFIFVYHTPDFRIFSSILSLQMPIFAPSSPYQSARSLRGDYEECARSCEGFRVFLAD